MRDFNRYERIFFFVVFAPCLDTRTVVESFISDTTGCAWNSCFPFFLHISLLVAKQVRLDEERSARVRVVNDNARLDRSDFHYYYY